MNLIIPTPIAMVRDVLCEATASDIVWRRIVAMFTPILFAGFLFRPFSGQKIATTALRFTIAANLEPEAGPYSWLGFE